MASSAMEEAIEISHELLPCSICGRTFLPAPLKKHIQVCERNTVRKRKIFDSLKQRVEGTDLAPFHQPTFLRKNNENQLYIPHPISAPDARSDTPRNQSKWKEKHEELVQAIRAAKGGKIMGPRRSISAVGTMGTTERCPHCERQFGPKSYDRHVDWCKDHKNRAVRSPANVLMAKERLEARTKYRVPPLNKSKRSITREKYSTSLSRTESVVSVRSASSLERSGYERNTLERNVSVRRPMVAPYHSSPEPVIKAKCPADKTKSPSMKQRPAAPKLNTPHINESVEGMVVSKVNICSIAPTKLTTWQDVDQASKASIFSINAHEISLALNTDNNELHTNNDDQLPELITVQNLMKKEQSNAETDDRQISITSTWNSTGETHGNDIVTIKEPPNNNYDMDSLYNDPEIQLSDKHFTLNKAYSNLEFNTNHTDMFMSDIKTQSCKTSNTGELNYHMEKDSLESMNSGLVWEQTDRDFLHSLKFKSNTSEMFSAELKTKYTSTPLQDKHSFETGSFTMRCEKLNFKDFLVIDETISLPILNGNDKTEVDFCDLTASIEDLSECIADLSPKKIPSQGNAEEIIDLLSNVSEKKSEDEILMENNDAQVFESKSSLNQFAEILEKDSSLCLNETNEQDKSDYIDGKRQCNIDDLDRFLRSQPAERQLEIEIIATEVCSDSKQPGPCLNMYQTHSKEIIIEGQTCLDTLNHLLRRNEVRSVNIIIVNEDICAESKVEPKKLENSNMPTIQVPDKKDSRNVALKTDKSPRRNFKTNKENLHLPPGPDSERLHSVRLPLVTDNRKLKTDDFWIDAEDIVSPLRIEKIELHEKGFIKPDTNRVVTFANLPSLFNTPRDTDEGDTPRMPTDYSLCKLPLFSTPRYHSSSPDEYNPFVVAEKQLMELLQCDDFKPYNTSSPSNILSSKCTPAKATIQKKCTKPNSNSKTPAAKRSSIIDPPDNFQDNMLVLQDNFELIENFINDNYAPNGDTVMSDNLKSTLNDSSGNNKNKASNGLSLNSILSARKYSDDTNTIDPSLINETDNLSIPDKLPLDNCSPLSSNNEIDLYSVQYDRKISISEPKSLRKSDKIKRSLSTSDEQTLDDIDFDEFISSFEDDESFPTLKSFLQNTKPDKPDKKVIQKSTVSLNSSFGKTSPLKGPEIKKTITPLKRSISVSNPVVKARSMKNKQDIQEYLHVKETKPAKKTDLEKSAKISPKSEELFPPEHEMYADYKKYKDLYEQERKEFIADQKKANGDVDFDELCTNEDLQMAKKIHGGKVSGDSAYGRKSPKNQSKAANRCGQVAQVQLRSSVERSPSSSGSEVSVTAPAKAKPRIPKFCHECGTKYPVDTAKFCVECGIKRLVL